LKALHGPPRQPQGKSSTPVLAFGKTVVDSQVLGHVSDEGDEGRGIRDDLCAQTLLDDGLDHIALVFSASKIAPGQQLALSYEPECFLTSDRDFALGIVKTVGSEGRLIDHRHTVQIFGELNEALEVDQHHVTHPYPGETLWLPA